MTSDAPRAFICGLAGATLEEAERTFFADAQPLGFILFARNCENKEQLSALSASLRDAVGRADAPILIDQEGGRVARLKPPQWREALPAGVYADLVERKGMEVARRASYLNARLMGAELIAHGITVDCAPMADIRFAESHAIVGDRAYGTTAEQVTALAGEVARGLMESGVMPVIKHIPGHGRALVDSHEALPIVEAELTTLRDTDFVPFTALKAVPWGMTAHITYTALDAEQPATLSPTVIQLIREEIGFDGLLLTDDVSMKALSGDMAAITKQSLAAGCDVVLHCNGEMAEMEQVAAVCPELSEAACARLARGWNALPEREEMDMAAGEEELKALLDKSL